MTELVCVVCPKGCRLTVDTDNGLKVTGNGCARGEKYARTETVCPQRTLTTTVLIEGAAVPRCPVRTVGTIARDSLMQAAREAGSIILHAPVKAGEVAAVNFCGTGVDLIVTRTLERVQI